MRGLLRLLVQHIVVSVTDKRSVVRVEEHLVRNLEGINGRFELKLLACHLAEGKRDRASYNIERL